jgi:hypothetical protein
MAIGMFFPQENPGYYDMSTRAASLVAGWSENDWYETSTAESDVGFPKEMAI